MKSNLTNEELIKRCNEWVHKLAETGGKAWTLRVPVDFNNDPDVLFIELGKRLEEYAQQQLAPSWVDDSISNTRLNIGRMEINCFDEDSEMSIKVGASRYETITVNEAKEVVNFIISHIKNETEANPQPAERSAQTDVATDDSEKWTIEYDNDTGAGDEGFWEWWTVSKAETSFRCYNNLDAIFLCNLLNKNPHTPVATDDDWISVEQNPKFNGEYNVAWDVEDGDSELVVTTMEFWNGKWIDVINSETDMTFYCTTVKYWRPLPKPPKQ